MKAVLFPLVAFAAFSVPAFAQQGDQTSIVQTPASTVDPSTVMRDDSYTFDLDDDAATSAPLPADAGDYETAAPSEVEMVSDLEFKL